MKWRGDGSYSYQVVGESYYQEHLNLICGGKTDNGHEHYCTAVIIPEANNPYDANSVAVHVDGGKVASFNRNEAAAYRTIMRHLNASGLVLECEAVIVGGWKYRNGDEGSYGVQLDLVFEMGFEP